MGGSLKPRRVQKKGDKLGKSSPKEPRASQKKGNKVETNLVRAWKEKGDGQRLTNIQVEKG